MALERTKSLQRVSSVAKSAASLIRAQNVPAEIGHCLQLVQLVHDDVHYLAELRDENLQRLEETPRELSRIDKIIETISHTLADIDGLMDKYKSGDQITSTTSVIWVLSDAESFKIRSTNLQAQHATLLNEIHHVKMVQLMARTSMRVDRHFENVNLLANLIGGKNKPNLGITQTNERPTSVPSSDQLTKSRTLSTDSTTSSSSSLHQTGHFDIRPTSSTDAISQGTTTTPRYSPNFHFSTAPQAEAVSHPKSRPASQSNPGLRSLFQPTPPLGHRKRAPSEGGLSSHHHHLYFSSNPLRPNSQQYRPSTTTLTNTPPPIPEGLFELEGSQTSYFPSASTSHQSSFSSPQELPPEPSTASRTNSNSTASSTSSPPSSYQPFNPPRPLHEEVSALSLAGSEGSEPHLRQEPSALSLAPSTTTTSSTTGTATPKRSLSPAPPPPSQPDTTSSSTSRNRGLSTLFPSSAGGGLYKQQQQRNRSADGRLSEQKQEQTTLFELDSGGQDSLFIAGHEEEEEEETGGNEWGIRGRGRRKGDRISKGGRIYKWWEPRTSELSVGVVGGTTENNADKDTENGNKEKVEVDDDGKGQEEETTKKKKKKDKRKKKSGNDDDVDGDNDDNGYGYGYGYDEPAAVQKEGVQQQQDEEGEGGKMREGIKAGLGRLLMRGKVVGNSS